MITTRKGLYAVRGLRGRNLRGLGQPPGYLETCDQSSVSAQWACAQRNMARQDEYYSGSSPAYAEAHGGVTPAQSQQSAYYASQVGSGNWACAGSECVNTVTGERRSVAPSPVVAPVPTSYAQYLAPTATSQAVAPPATYSPHVTFSSSRGGSTLYPGDTWTIVLTGAAPGAQIKVTGGKNGANDTNVMGTADSTGRFSLAGTAGSAELGTWNETWTAGGANAGSFSFTVAAGPGGTTSGGGSTAGSGNTTMTPASGFSMGWFTEQMISGIPNWWLLVGGAVAGLALAGGKH